MTPARELTAALLCDPVLDDEIPARDVALSVLGSLERPGPWKREAPREVRRALRMGALGVDPRAALMGGARGEDGDVLRAGCGL